MAFVPIAPRVRVDYQPGDWVPEDQRDTRWYLWTPMFMCRVPNIQTMSPEYIKHFGMPTSGIEEYDRQTANELVHRMLTINQMVDFYAQGTSVEVCDSKDTKTIYEHISNHLSAWRKEVENGFHIKNAPLDELQMLDKFANKVYEHAQWHFDKPFVDSVFARQMGGLVTVTRDSIIAKKPKKVEEELRKKAELSEPLPEQPTPGRVSMAEVFASQQAAARPKWDRY